MDVELSVLAHTLYRVDGLLPQGLCAMASLKNLQKDHDAAIAFLTQAVSVTWVGGGGEERKGEVDVWAGIVLSNAKVLT